METIYTYMYVVRNKDTGLIMAAFKSRTDADLYSSQVMDQFAIKSTIAENQIQINSL